MNVKETQKFLKMFRGAPPAKSGRLSRKEEDARGVLEEEREASAEAPGREFWERWRLVLTGAASHEGSLQGHRAVRSEGAPMLRSAVTILKFLIIFKGAPSFIVHWGPYKIM